MRTILRTSEKYDLEHIELSKELEKKNLNGHRTNAFAVLTLLRATQQMDHMLVYSKAVTIPRGMILMFRWSDVETFVICMQNN